MQQRPKAPGQPRRRLGQRPTSAAGTVSSTPHSSNVSRTAALTRARAAQRSSAEAPREHGAASRPSHGEVGRRRRRRPPRRGTRACRRRTPSRSGASARPRCRPSPSRRSATVAGGSRHRGALGTAQSADLDDDSTSTGASSGSTATPTALRACDAGVAEHVAEQLARTVHDAGLAGEVRGARDEADDLDDADDRFERSPISARIAASAFSAHRAASSLAWSGVDLGADLAGRGERAVDHRELARGVDVRAGAHGRDVRRDGAAHGRQREPELRDALLAGWS